MKTRIDEAYFTTMYAADQDPWGFDTRWYERRKYDLTIAALPRERYRRGFEAGCANGALTTRLAPRCDELIAFELVPEVAERARARMASHPGVSITTGAIPDVWPDGTFDLFVLSEVLYYFHPLGFTEVLKRVERSAMTQAHVVAVHWRGETSYPMTGDRVHAELQMRWSRVVRYREESFALDVFEVA